MAKTSPAAAAPAAAPLVRYRMPPTGGDGVAPYQPATFHVGPADQLPPGAMLAPVYDEHPLVTPADPVSVLQAEAEPGAVTDIDGHPVA